ncbi:hypothetical protein STSP2_02094 [Anaerohalosphaera lusitana]|uniref:Uncharacterized protein n=1 Tax=Anaerohalosphaera lusitana TaxID=1936003 RepID=A0A1U9NM85_9BACT|nr:hypothetical protein STSP2_02094 [Anaerohalosphaera lusitana]
MRVICSHAAIFRIKCWCACVQWLSDQCRNGTGLYFEPGLDRVIHVEKGGWGIFNPDGFKHRCIDTIIAFNAISHDTGGFESLAISSQKQWDVLGKIKDFYYTASF